MDTQKEQIIDKELLYTLLESYSDVESSDLIPLLQQIQEAYGYLPPLILKELGKKTKIPISRIYGVATFYKQFHIQPHGRHTIRCCRGTACHVNNGSAIIGEIQEILNVEPGQTTNDMKFTFDTVACLGTCFLAPVLMVNNEYYGHVDSEKLKTILQSYS